VPQELLGISNATAMPFILRYLERVELGPGARLEGNNRADACAGDERRWTHYDDSTGILSTESDTVTDS
jgi:hypothetical protein